MEIVGWMGVAVGAILVVTALGPLPRRWRRQVPHVRPIVAAMGITVVGSEGQDLHWSDRFQTPLAAAALTLWAVALVRLAWARRNKKS
ncbi:hypothetical protein AB0D34_45130 [Streptomyces sp. NPDC048420]|uniref:hypothetical protein n=1 Tax=Streptomyces sp. NPDC048420 TaxID=3155755 RepID=UPI0034326191